MATLDMPMEESGFQPESCLVPQYLADWDTETWEAAGLRLRPINVVGGQG